MFRKCAVPAPDRYTSVLTDEAVQCGSERGAPSYCVKINGHESQKYNRRDRGKLSLGLYVSLNQMSNYCTHVFFLALGLKYRVQNCIIFVTIFLFPCKTE